MTKTDFAAAALLITAIFGADARAAELEVVVSGVRSDAGGVRLALFDDVGNFLKQGRRIIVDAAAGTVRGIFKDVSTGTFALAVHHDENGNNEIEKNFFGMPTEGHGFSNDATGVFGPPRFSDAAFFVDRDKASITVNVNY